MWTDWFAREIYWFSFFYCPLFFFIVIFFKYIFCGRAAGGKGFPYSNQRVLLWQIFIVCAYISTWVVQSAGGCFNGSSLFLLTFLSFFYFQRSLLFGVGSSYYWSVRWPPPMIITQSSSIPLVWLFCCRCQCNGTAHSGRRGEQLATRNGTVQLTLSASGCVCFVLDVRADIFLLQIVGGTGEIYLFFPLYCIVHSSELERQWGQDKKRRNQKRSGCLFFCFWLCLLTFVWGNQWEAFYFLLPSATWCRVAGPRAWWLVQKADTFSSSATGTASTTCPVSPLSSSPASRPSPLRPTDEIGTSWKGFFLPLLSPSLLKYWHLNWLCLYKS